MTAICHLQSLQKLDLWSTTCRCDGKTQKYPRLQNQLNTAFFITGHYFHPVDKTITFKVLFEAALDFLPRTVIFNQELFLGKENKSLGEF